VAKIEAAIKDAILRGSRRQVRAAVAPLRRDLRRLRRVVAALRRDLATLGDVAAQWQRTTGGRPWRPDVSEDQARQSRLSPRLVGKLRARLGLSQAALARLVGVSTGAVAQWERGGASPAGDNRRALIGLRQVGRRDVKRMLASQAGSAGGRKAGRPGRRRGGRRRKASVSGAGRAGGRPRARGRPARRR
jgi:DNA-binding XRE family transcriptional regulator